MDNLNNGLTLFGTILTALIASQTVLVGVRRWYERGWGSRRLWRKKLNSMANWVTDEYVTDLLGIPVFRNQGSIPATNTSAEKEWIDRVYTTPHAWVVTRSVEERVEAWSVTLTDPKFWWDVEEVTFKVIKGRLGRATFESLSTKPSGRFESRGAHRYEYAEITSAGNPGGYQSFIFMYNMAGFGTPHPSGEDVVKTGDFSDDEDYFERWSPPPANETRKKTVVNTLVVTAPSWGINEIARQSWPKVERDQTRLLPRYQRKFEQRRGWMSLGRDHAIKFSGTGWWWGWISRILGR